MGKFKILYAFYAIHYNILYDTYIRTLYVIVNNNNKYIGQEGERGITSNEDSLDALIQQFKKYCKKNNEKTNYRSQ